MAELTINIRLDYGDDTFDIDIDEASFEDKDIQSYLDYDKEFQSLLAALGERFAQIVAQIDMED